MCLTFVSSRVSLSHSRLSVVGRRRRPSSVVIIGTFLNGWTDSLETWWVGTLTKTGRTLFSARIGGSVSENNNTPF